MQKEKVKRNGPVSSTSLSDIKERSSVGNSAVMSLLWDFSEFTLASVVRPPAHEQEREREANTDGMPGLCLCFLCLLL